MLFRAGRRGRQVEVLFEQGVAFYRAGRFTEAAQKLGALGDQPGPMGQLARYYQGMSHRAMGLDALARGQYDLAHEQLRTAVKLLGPNANLSAYLASLYAKAGQPEQVCREAERAAAGGGPQAVRKLAQAQWQAGRREAAMMTLTEALRRHRDHVGLHLQMGLFHASCERWAEAQASLTQAVECGCDDSQTHYYLGLLYAATDQLPQAISELQRAVDLDPANLVATYQLSLAAKAAWQSGHRIVLHLPDRPTTEAGSAIRQLSRYVTAEPQFVDAILSLPASDAEEELMGVLAAVVKTALAAHPGYADLRLLCSRILDRLGQTDEAIEHGRMAIERNPSYLQALIHLGDLYERAGRLAEAVDSLAAAIEAGGEWADVHFRLAKLSTRLGRMDQTAHHLERALTINQGFAAARDEQTRLAA